MTLEDKISHAHAVLAAARAEHFTRHQEAAVVVLFSGGNDSTLLAHLFRDEATHAAHANTGVGIEQTRQFVRDTCQSWGLPLIERSAPRQDVDGYRALVLDQGFPGPAHHWKMYQRLKERALRTIRAELVQNPRRERVIFLAGRRRDESARRGRADAVPEVERKGSTVWVSPLATWTNADMNAYRRANPDMPRNEVADLIHMSGECLCGAFAKQAELDEIGYWFPEVAAELHALEAEVLATGRHPAWKCRWGWGADKGTIERMKADGMTDEAIAEQFAASKSGAMCSSCTLNAVTP